MRAGLSAFLVFIATGVSAEAPAVPQVRGASLTVETHDRKPDLKEFNPGQCFPIRAIHIHGIEVIDVNAVKQAVEPLAYHCLDNALAGALVLAVNKVHADAGFITTQGALPDQDIRKEKTLTINVYTGTIGRILYEEPETDEDPPLFTRLGNRWTAMRKADGIWRGIQGVSDLIDTLDDPLDRFQLLDGRRFNGLKPWTSFMNKPGDVLHLDRIQRDADNLNRVSSNKAEVKLKAGERPATSDVVFTNPQRDSFRLQVGYERNGTALNNTGSTVDQRVRFDMAKDNLIGINDSWRGVFAGGINTNEATLSLGIPWRRFNFGVNGSYSESLSDIMQGVELMQRTGIVTATLGASLEKTSRVQSSMDASLMWRLSERHINGAALTDQSVAVARLGFSRTHLFDTWQVYYGAGFSQGLKILGVTEDPDDPAADVPRAQFRKWDAAAGFIKGFKGIGTFRLDCSGQWTDTPLYSDDQLTLGSSSSVRGFTNLPEKVDRGGVLRSEFAFALPKDWLFGKSKDRMPFAWEFVGGLEPYIYADYGFGENIANDDFLARAGVGAGLRYRQGRVNIDFSYAYPIYEKGPDHRDKGPEIYLTATVKLF